MKYIRKKAYPMKYLTGHSMISLSGAKSVSGSMESMVWKKCGGSHCL